VDNVPLKFPQNLVPVTLDEDECEDQEDELDRTFNFFVVYLEFQFPAVVRSMERPGLDRNALPVTEPSETPALFVPTR
jgi:hypothetical protein